MEMSIDDVIRYFKDMEKACCCGTEQASIAIETMRKYQLIEEIVKSKTTRVSYDIGFRQIKKVVEDGKID